jgi:KUP system potassium uptake protein
VVHGGWVPLLIATAVLTVMTTWRRGRQQLMANRHELEGSLHEFVEEVRARQVPRVPGVAVFPHPNKETTPLALRANVDHNHVLHRQVVIVSMSTVNLPHVPASEAFTLDDLGHADDGIQHVEVQVGFSDSPDIPRALRAACATGRLDPELERSGQVSYFVSRGGVRRTRAPGMPRWRKALFVVLAHNAADPAAYFGLPPERTVTMGSDVDL